MMLFHGTSSTNPAVIYNNQDGNALPLIKIKTFYIGFDMRYCSSGMWGIAIYFAVKASFSDSGYKFTNPNGLL